MKKLLFIFLSMLFVSAQSYGLNYTISFTASGATTTVGSVEVKNLTKGTIVTVPNGNTLTLSDGPSAVDDLNANESSMLISQDANTGISTLKFYVTQSGSTQVSAFALDGRKIVGQNITTEEGVNALELMLPKGLFVVRVTGHRYDYTSKLLNSVSTNKLPEIKYLSNTKIEGSKMQKSKTTPIQTTNMTYTTGDQLLFTATSTTYIFSLRDVPTSSKIINFNFATIPTSAIPAGTFMMGSPDSEANRNDDEVQHTVTLSAFRMTKYEITNAQYAAFLNAKSIGSDGLYAAGANPDKELIYETYESYNWGLKCTNSSWMPVSGYENHPVINVTWYGATEFATYVGGTLPTESQWEYACCAGTTTPFNTGNCISNAQANYFWLSPYSTCSNTTSAWPSRTQPVGIYNANAWGLHDMHGNVQEWCSDFYGAYPTGSQTNPLGATSGLRSVHRGGSWNNGAQICRSAYRGNFVKNTYMVDLGFRVVFVP